MWIEKICVEGFRGYPKRVEFEFNCKPFVFIFGDNKSGKSSLLNAIEWTLFGEKIAEEKSTRIPERKSWAIRNFRAKRTEAEIVLKDREGKTVTVRAEIKRAQKKTEIKIMNSELSPEEYFKINLRDFMAGIHLHQEVLRKFITAPPQERGEVLVRLLGLSVLKNLELVSREVTVPLKEEVERIKLDLQSVINEKRKIYENEIKNIKETLKIEDFKEELISEKKKEIEDTLSDIYEKYGMDYKRWQGVFSGKDFGEFFGHVEKNIRSLRTKIPVYKEYQFLSGRKESIKKFKGSLETIKKEIESENKKIREIENRYGVKEEIERKLETIEREIERIDREIEMVNLLASIYERMLSWIKTQESIETCPICGANTSKEGILANIHLRNAEVSEDRIKELNEEKRKKEEQMKELKKCIKEITLIEKNIKTLEERKENIRKELTEFFKEDIHYATDLLSYINLKEKETDEKIKEIEEQVKNAEKIFTEIDCRLKELEGLLKIKEYDAKIKNLHEKAKKVIQEIKKVEQESKALVNAIDEIAEKSKELANLKTREVFEKIKDRICRYFMDITQRTDFEELFLDPNGYTIKAKNGDEERPIMTFFNQADMNASALAIFLALAIQEPVHKLGFIILDDPSQSLDSEYKKRLAKVLEDVIEKGNKQVIVATMDREFQEILKNTLKSKKIFYLKNWTPEIGPEIEVRE